MSNQPESPADSKVFDMPEPTPGTTRSDLPRWAELGLSDPPRDGALPEDGETADVLGHAVILPGSIDPVEGGVAAVRAELRAVETLASGWGRRLDAMLLLLRRADGRAKSPPSSKDE